MTINALNIRPLRILAVLLTWLACNTASADDARLEALEEQAFQQAAALVAPSVVRIDTVGGVDQVGEGITVGGPSTGVIISPDGEIISSSFPFASKPSTILVTLADERRLPAAIVATDRQRMLTLLKVDATNLPVPPVVERDAVRVGQWALALGRTLDADSPSVSVGIVSALGRVWGKAIQTDAKVSPVNYGGPLVDVSGRVMGILAPLSTEGTDETTGVEWYDSGIGFAVPMTDLFAVLDRLREGHDLLPGLMGVTFKNRDLVGAEPVFDRVRLGSPAEKAGLKAGDRITEVDGQPVTLIAQVRTLLARKYASDEIAMTYRRDDQSATATLKLAAEIPPYQRGFLGILPQRNAGGVAAVRFVYPDSPAENVGLKSKDVIVSVNGQETPTSRALADAISRIRPADAATLVVKRGEETLTLMAAVAVEPQTVLENLPAAASDASPAAANGPVTGRISETVAGHERPFWAYVPESYRPQQPAGLMIALSANDGPSEQQLLRQWKTECERRGMILLALEPAKQGGFVPHDVEYLRDSVKHLREKYTVADERIWLYATGNAGQLGLLLAFRERETYRGLALINTPLPGQVPETDPDHHLQLFIAQSPGHALSTKLKPTLAALRKLGYSVANGVWSAGDASETDVKPVEELSRWADSLDRI